MVSKDEERARDWLRLLHVLCTDGDVGDALRRNDEYRSFCVEFCQPTAPCGSSTDHPLSEAPESSWSRFFQDKDIRDQIDRDLARTQVDLSFFREPSNQAKMARALFIYHKLSGVAYTQGMNEVFAVLYYVMSKLPEPLEPEVLAFYGYLQLMSEFREFYCAQLDDSEIGINATMDKVGAMLARAAPLLEKHLNELHIVPILWAFRPATCLFAQTFLLPDVLCIWDRMLAAKDKMQFVVCVIAAIALVQADELILADFPTAMSGLQNVEYLNIAKVLRQVERLLELDI